MPTIKVNITQLGSYESDIQDILSRINSIQSQFDTVSRNLDWDIKAESSINSCLTGISQDLSIESRGLSGMKSFLGLARGKYDEVERKNSGETLENGSIVSSYATKVLSNTINVRQTGYSDSGASRVSFSAVDPNATYVTGEGSEKGEPRGLFGTIVKGSVLSGSKNCSKWFFGHKGEADFEGDVLGGEIKTSSGATWDSQEGEIGAGIKISADGYSAKGKISTSYGLASLEASGTVGAVGASGEIGATLQKGGKFAPSVGGGFEAEAAAFKGGVKTSFGSEDNNLYFEAKGKAFVAEASAMLDVGNIKYEDSGGNTHTGYGAKVEIGFETYVAKGSISGGINLLGIDLNLSVEGKVGGAGAKAAGDVTSSSASGEIGLGLLFGAGVKVEVDWSNFVLFKKK